MAFQWGSPTINDNNDGNSTTLVLDKPDDVAEGTLLFTFLRSDDDGTTTHTTLSPWQLIGSQGDSSSSDTRISAYYLVAGASEPSTYTWTQSLSMRFAGMCVVLSGADTADVIDVSTFIDDDVWDANITCPSVVATDDDGLLVTFHGGTGGRINTPPGGHSKLWDIYPDFGSDGGAGGSVGYETLSSSGATGTRVWTRSGDDRDCVSSFIINIAPPVVGTWGKRIDLDNHRIVRVVR